MSQVEEILATVFFEDTTDSYFYDLFDRKLKYTLEEEVEWELEVSRGTTCSPFKDWLKNRIELQAVVPDWPHFDQ